MISDSGASYAKEMAGIYFPSVKEHIKQNSAKRLTVVREREREKKRQEIIKFRYTDMQHEEEIKMSNASREWFSISTK